MGGPILDTPEVLLVAKAATAVAAEQRTALDPWTLGGHLHIARVRSWQLRLGKLGWRAGCFARSSPAMAAHSASLPARQRPQRLRAIVAANGGGMVRHWRALRKPAALDTSWELAQVQHEPAD